MFFGTFLDLGKNEIRNSAFQVLASNPSTPSTGQFYWNSASGLLRIYDGAVWDEYGTGGGTVTSFSAGDLSPLFTTLEATVSTTPALTFTLSNASGNTVFASPSNGSSGAPSYRSLVQADLPATVPVSYWGAATANVALGGFKITGLADGTAATDAATFGQVSNLFQGVRDYKESVRLASTGNVTVTYNATGGTSARGQITAAPNTLNGSTLVAGNRILLKDQSTGAQNGIWVVTTVGTGANGVWDRATDFDADVEVTSGLMVAVTEFTTTDNRGTYLLSTVDPIVIGGGSGTALTFTSIASVAGYVGGAGITQNGFTFDVVSANAGIAVGANNITLTLDSNSGLQTTTGLKIVSDVTTSNTLGLTLTANGAGTKYDANSFTESSEALALATGVAGAGLTLTTGVLSVTGYTVVSSTTVARKFAAAITLATGAYSQVVTHNLNTKDVQAYTYDSTSDDRIMTEIDHTSVNTVTISGVNNTGSSISARCVVVG